LAERLQATLGDWLIVMIYDPPTGWSFGRGGIVSITSHKSAERDIGAKAQVPMLVSPLAASTPSSSRLPRQRHPHRTDPS
jgi:hypothetical protein